MLTPSATPSWIGPLLATLVMQTTSAFLSRLIPTIAPVLTVKVGMDPASVGYVTAIGTIGSIVFLMAGTPVIRRAGAIRALQIGQILGAFGVLTLAAPILVAPALASFLIGFGYGPSAPAGSDVLQRYAPAQHRTLIFSLKQAGVPVGGVAAGVLLPALVGLSDWRFALAASALIACVSIALVQPLRGGIDADRDASASIGWRDFLSLDNVRRPIIVLGRTPELARICIAGGCFAVGQGTWFSFFVTYAVTELHLDLTSAGLLFAIMQASGIGGRIFLGWISDRMGSGIATLKVVGIASAVTTIALALTTTAWPFWALAVLAAIAGITVSSWNGVQIAEVARAAPPGLVSETTAGATILIFIGYVVGPAGFAAVIAATGRYDVAYFVVAGLALLAVAALVRMGVRQDKAAGAAPR